MHNLHNKKILLGITGSIAAYKSAELIRLLRAAGCEVKVVLTQDGTHFVTELTLQALSGQPVYQELLDPESEASMSHITLAKWADLILIAPATANVLAKFASGLADDLLTTLYLASNAPMIIAPAMNQQMWRHPATLDNTERLKARGILFVGPADGLQACGDVGPGRMLEPQAIVHQVANFFAPKMLAGINLLITAGPTREPIDSVRYISNYSSGKMGYALAAHARLLGATVTLISGPTALAPPDEVHCVAVETCQEMQQAVDDHVAAADIFIAAAAVADFSPVVAATQKIKKSDLPPSISLQLNNDILASVSARNPAPFVVGFAAESEDLLRYAKQKLVQKNLDMIIANQIGLKDSGFNSDYNAVTVLTQEQIIELPRTSKVALAGELISIIYTEFCRVDNLKS